MLSDLSPGDRLSLKGKIFELQKKLNIIGLEQELEEKPSFKPNINEYDLPNRPRNFYEQSQKVEMMKQQKKKLLEDMLQMQNDETCTFKPQIHSSPFHKNLDSRPVHVRLSEKGKVYQDSKERLRDQFTNFDDEGNKLFTPRINKIRLPITPTTGNSQTKASLYAQNSEDSCVIVAVDDFLYQDAKDRELRLENLRMNYKQEVVDAANSSKMNPNSEKMLRRKIERECRLLFEFMDLDEDDIIDYEDSVKHMNKVHLFETISHDQKLKFYQIFWTVVDYYKRGSVSKTDFILLTSSFLISKSIGECLSSYEKKILNVFKSPGPQNPPTPISVSYNTPQLNSNFNSPTPSSPNSNLPLYQMKEKDLALFKEILSQVLEVSLRFLQRNPEIILPSQQRLMTDKSFESLKHTLQSKKEEVPTFQPKISVVSQKLAENKMKKDIEELSNMALPPPPPPQAEPGSPSSPPPPPPNDSNDKDQVNQNPKAQEAPGESSQPLKLKSHHELMYARSILSQKRKDKLVHRLVKEEMKDCTFQPTLKTNPSLYKNNQEDTPQKKSELISHPDTNHYIRTPTMPKNDDTEDQIDSDLTPDREDSESHLNYNAVQDLDSPEKESSRDVDTVESLQMSQTSHDERRKQKVHERLYSYKDKHLRVRKQNSTSPIPGAGPGTPTYLQELQHCTFQPKITKLPSYYKQTEKSKDDAIEVDGILQSKPVVVNQQGYEKSIQRMRAIHEKKLQEKIAKENEWKDLEIKYQRSRQVSSMGAKPFNFETEKRQQDKVLNKLYRKQQQKIKPDLIIGVKISNTKTAKIRISQDDDPLQITNRVAKIYSFDRSAHQILFTVICNSMIQNNLLSKEYLSTSPYQLFMDSNEISDQVISDERLIQSHEQTFAGQIMPNQLQEYHLTDSKKDIENHTNIYEDEEYSSYTESYYSEDDEDNDEYYDDDEEDDEDEDEEDHHREGQNETQNILEEDDDEDDDEQEDQENSNQIKKSRRKKKGRSSILSTFL